MLSRIGVALPIALIFVMPVVANAQQRTQLAFATSQSALVAKAVVAAPAALQEPPSSPEEIMGASGFFLGIVSMMGGAAFGSGLASCDDEINAKAEDECVTDTAVKAALIAGTIAAPIGVHLAAPKRKNLLKSIAVSAGIAGAMYGVFYAIPGHPTAIAPFLTMPLQIYATVRFER
jgi:hypothetical protein